jgi:hypothetical protein
MPSSRSPRPDAGRRALVAAGLASAVPLLHAAEADVEALLRAGGVVIAFRHALAPGTFDPPGFRLGECSTQRNLSDEGRAQARRIGEWFRARQLVPQRVRSSPWCRCVDTANLAFGDRPGSVEAWPALGSPRGASETTNAESTAALRRAVAEAATRRGRFEAWVTHMFVLSDLVREGSASGEGLVLRAGRNGAVEVAARLALA